MPGPITPITADPGTAGTGLIALASNDRSAAGTGLIRLITEAAGGGLDSWTTFTPKLLAVTTSPTIDWEWGRYILDATASRLIVEATFEHTWSEGSGEYYMDLTAQRNAADTADLDLLGSETIDTATTGTAADFSPQGFGHGYIGADSGSSQKRATTLSVTAKTTQQIRFVVKSEAFDEIYMATSGNWGGARGRMHFVADIPL